MFTAILATFFFIFPPTERLYRIHRAFRLDKLWTRTGGLLIFGILIVFFAFGLTDENFRLIVLKPDNVPIVGLIFLVVFFLWLSLSQAYENDRRIDQGKPPQEAEDAKEKVLVWPDLVYIELIAIVCAAALLAIWAISLPAPLEVDLGDPCDGGTSWLQPHHDGHELF